MSANIALLLCGVYVVWLLRAKSEPSFSGHAGLWACFLFLLIISSRPVSFWFSSVDLVFDPGDYVEGSPVDRTAFLVLMVFGLILLARKQFSWTQAVVANKGVFLFYAYLFLSIAWSDFTFVSLKRVVKDFSCVIFVFTLLSLPEPQRMIRLMFSRVSYVWFPLSVVFIKYMPQLGRAYTRAGDPMATGVTTQKNSLGELVLVCSFFLIWDLWKGWRETRAKSKMHLWISRGSLLFIGLWLLHASQSKNATVCLLLGSTLFLIAHKVPKALLQCVFMVALASPILILFGLPLIQVLLEPVLSGLGRDMTFTGRTLIWNAVLDQPLNWIFGAGFYSFWMTPSGDAAWQMVGSRAATSHNGYLETFLDGGMIGLLLLIGLIARRGFSLMHSISSDSQRLKFCLLLVAIVYNLAEASFARLGPVWVVTLLAVLHYPAQESDPIDEPSLQAAESISPRML